MSDDGVGERAAPGGDVWDRLAHVSRELLTIAAPDGTLTYADPAFAHALGWSVEQVLARRALDLVHPDDRARAQRAWNEVVGAPGAESRTEYRLLAADGSFRWMEVATINLLGDPEVAGIATCLHDVTARRDAEDELRVNAERYRALVQHSYDAIVVTDEQMVASWASPAFEAMFGYSPSDLVGVRGTDHIHPADLPLVAAQARPLLAAPGARVRSTFRMRTRGGEWRVVECRSVNLLDHPSVRGIVNNFRDITDERAALTALASSERRLTALLRNSDGAVLLVDPRGRVRWASDPIERLVGDPPDALRGSAAVDRLHPDDRSLGVEAFGKVLEDPGATTRVEVRVRHADGSMRWVEAVWTNCLDDPAVGGVVGNLRDVTERVLADQALRRSEADLKHQATHDSLTGLPNRLRLAVLFDRWSADPVASRGAAALVCFDLDRFTWVNDSRGHEVGDAVLRSIARRLETAAGPSTAVGRFGGDEFAVLLFGIGDIGDALAEAERLRQEISGPLAVDGGGEVFVAASAGVAIVGRGGGGFASLIRDADSAMSQAKHLGRDRVEVFDERMRARATHRLEVEGRLRTAVERRELRVHYQPLVEVASGQVVAVEALVRWQHPEHGLLLPGGFIEVAEQSGLVLAIDGWVLEQATGTAASWSTAAHSGRSPAVCVNVSARQFADPDMVHRLARCLDASGLRPDRLHVEITESVLMEDVAASVAVLDGIRDLGVRVAIDDFGTGYSSLSYLRRLPVDILKIDRAFVRGLGRDDHDTAIVEAVVGLAHRLGLQVVAEGVEEGSQLDHLRSIGCDVVQGFLLSRPVDAEAIASLLRSGPLV